MEAKAGHFLTSQRIYVFDLCSGLTSRTIGCPLGAERMGQPPPAGFEQWCQRLDEKRNYVRHGSYNSWYENGQKKIQGKYVMGRRHGTWTMWNEKGKRIAEIQYLNSKPFATWEAPIGASRTQE
jgi:hypothetical protein